MEKLCRIELYIALPDMLSPMSIEQHMAVQRLCRLAVQAHARLLDGTVSAYPFLVGGARSGVDVEGFKRGSISYRVLHIPVAHAFHCHHSLLVPRAAGCRKR